MGQAQSQSSGSSDCGDCGDSGNADSQYGYGKFHYLKIIRSKHNSVYAGPDPITALPGRLTDSKPGGRVEIVDAYGRPISGTGSTAGTGSYPGYTTGTGSGGSFPIGTKPNGYNQQNGVSGPGGSSPGSFSNGHGGSGPGSSYTNGRPNGKKKCCWTFIFTKYKITKLCNVKLYYQYQKLCKVSKQGFTVFSAFHIKIVISKQIN